MKFEFDDQQLDLAASAKRLFARYASPAAIRASWDDPIGRSPELWRGIVELGLPSVLIPEEYDGAGGSLLDLCPTLEEIGRGGVPDALVEGLVVAPLALSLATAEPWLPDVAAGSVRATAALYGLDAVPDAHVSDLIVGLVDGELTILTRDDRDDEAVCSMDQSRRLFCVVPRRGAGTPLGADADTVAQLRAVQHVANALVLVGLSQTMLDRTIDYVQIRKQFGRLIGSFQGVKHQLAHAVSLVAMARLAAQAAAARVVDGEAIAGRSARYARICAGDAAREANRVTLQLHGGIGFTWENDLQIWLKRGKALEQADGGRAALTRGAGRELIASLA